MVGRMQGVSGGKGYLAMPVRRTPDGRWRYRVVVDLPDGEQIRISGSAPRHNNNKDAARQAEHDHMLRVLTEASAPKKEPVQEAPTVNEFVKPYLEISTLKNKPSSIRAKESLLRMHLLPRVGHIKLDQVTYAVIEDLKVDLAKTPLSNFQAGLQAEAEEGEELLVSEDDQQLPDGSAPHAVDRAQARFDCIGAGSRMASAARTRV
jgi:hypothetical protein